MDENEIILVIIRRADGGGSRYDSLAEAIAAHTNLTEAQAAQWLEIAQEAQAKWSAADINADELIARVFAAAPNAAPCPGTGTRT